MRIYSILQKLNCPFEIPVASMQCANFTQYLGQTPDLVSAQQMLFSRNRLLLWYRRLDFYSVCAPDWDTRHSTICTIRCRLWNIGGNHHLQAKFLSLSLFLNRIHLQCWAIPEAAGQRGAALYPSEKRKRLCLIKAWCRNSGRSLAFTYITSLC